MATEVCVLLSKSCTIAMEPEQILDLTNIHIARRINIMEDETTQMRSLVDQLNQASDRLL